MTEEPTIESIPTEAPSTPPETPAPETTQGEPPAEAGETPLAAAPIPSSFQPNFKYRHNDGEQEIEEFWRPLIKDKESEAKIREACQKLSAFEEYKGYKQQAQQAGEWKDTVSEVTQLQELYQAKKHEELLERIGYDDEALFNIVREKIARRNMPPEQKAAYEEKKQREIAFRQLSSQNEEYKNRLVQETASRINYQIDTELEKPQYQTLAEKFEVTNGKGSFRDYVISRGEILSNRAGVTVLPSDVLSGIMKEYSAFMPSSAESQVAHKNKLNVVPNVRSAGSSPEKTQVKGLDDIRRLAQLAAGADID